MPKFKVGDEVVPKNVKFVYNTATHQKYSYVNGMEVVMRKGGKLRISYVGEFVTAGAWNWDEEDLEFFNICLENK